jgi:hypothetical protein
VEVELDVTDIVKIWEVVQVFHRYTPFQRFALLLGAPITVYFLYLCTLGRPPLTLYQVDLFLLQDRQVRKLPSGGETFEIEFRLMNATRPSAEVHNLFGQLWVEGTAFVASSIPPARGANGSGHVEWDIQADVLPKQAAFVPPKIVLRMPDPSGEIMVGAQLVSTETEKEEYLWRVVNENGTPRPVVVKAPREFK